MLFFAVSVKAQQRPQWTQYMVNQYLVNPAVAGSENYVDVRAGYRAQWTNFSGGGQPHTAFISANAPIGKAMCMNTRTRHRTSGYHGIGGYMLYDQTGPSKRIGTYLSYAYHLRLGKDLFASMGVTGGALQYVLDANQLDIANGNTSNSVYYQGNDVAATSYRKWIPDFTVGTWIYGKDFYVGASVNQVVDQKLDFAFNGIGTQAPSNTGKLVQHTFLTGGYNIHVDRDLTVIPSVMVKGVIGAPLSFDLNCKVRYMNTYWAGISYRRGDALAVMAGFVISQMFDVNYSYDITLSDIRKYSSGSHEIMLGYRIPLQQNLICPSHFW